MILLLLLLLGCTFVGALVGRILAGTGWEFWASSSVSSFLSIALVMIISTAVSDRDSR